VTDTDSRVIFSVITHPFHRLQLHTVNISCKKQTQAKGQSFHTQLQLLSDASVVDKTLLNLLIVKLVKFH